jgi:hypothetical protein
VSNDNLKKKRDEIMNEINVIEDISSVKIDEYEHFPLLEKIVDILKVKTNVSDGSFFRIITLYKLSQMLTMMRITVSYVGGKNIPVNIYALALADSGFSKGRSMSILEDELFHKFKEKFKYVYADEKNKNLAKIAESLAIDTDRDEDICYREVLKTFDKFPSFIYSAGAGTEEGLKGLMSAFDMTKIASVNIEIDEIGDQLLQNDEVLSTMLTTYDVGKIKNKLRKTDSQKDLNSSVPTNLCMFGTPTRLLDGGATENKFQQFLETGYARRLIFAYINSKDFMVKKNSHDKYNDLVKLSSGGDLSTLANDFEKYADKALIGSNIELTKEATLLLFDYQSLCLERTELFKKHESVKATEMEHRYFRVLKISGIYAALELSINVEKKHIEHAIKIVEESGEAFSLMLKKDKPYVRLAKYLSDIDTEVTQADLIEDLPFFKGSESNRRDIISLAKAWGHANGIIITEKINDKKISFYKAEKVKDTSLDFIRCSFSNHMAENYKPIDAKWDEYDFLVKSNYQYCVHHFDKKEIEKDGVKKVIKGYRTTDCVIEGFNLIVLDVDDGLSIEIAKEMLKDYTYIIATTKRHTESHNRYRILLPMKQLIKLNPDEYRSFMENVFDYLPFSLSPDKSTKDITRTWAGNPNAEIHKNEGKLIDPALFIQGTDNNKMIKNKINQYSNFDKLERWIIMNTEGRNNTLIKIGLMHVDGGKNIDEAMAMVKYINEQFSDPLSDREIHGTILKTITKKFYENGDKHEK